MNIFFSVYLTMLFLHILLLYNESWSKSHIIPHRWALKHGKSPHERVHGGNQSLPFIISQKSVKIQLIYTIYIYIFCSQMH